MDCATYRNGLSFSGDLVLLFIVVLIAYLLSLLFKVLALITLVFGVCLEVIFTHKSPRMTYSELLEFVRDYMPKNMRHIYLPLLIGELVDADGSATVRQLAGAVLAKDESQVMYYEKRLKDMPLKVLKKHGIITQNKKLVTLEVSKISFDQKSEIKMLCEKALREFIIKKGLGIWDYSKVKGSSPLLTFIYASTNPRYALTISNVKGHA